MSLYDDPMWLLSHISHSFVLSDESGVSETGLARQEGQLIFTRSLTNRFLKTTFFFSRQMVRQGNSAQAPPRQGPVRAPGRGPRRRGHRAAGPHPRRRPRVRDGGALLQHQAAGRGGRGRRRSRTGGRGRLPPTPEQHGDQAGEDADGQAESRQSQDLLLEGALLPTLRACAVATKCLSGSHSRCAPTVALCATPPAPRGGRVSKPVRSILPPGRNQRGSGG